MARPAAPRLLAALGYVWRVKHQASPLHGGTGKRERGLGLKGLAKNSGSVRLWDEQDERERERVGEGGAE